MELIYGDFDKNEHPCMLVMGCSGGTYLVLALQRENQSLLEELYQYRGDGFRGNLMSLTFKDAVLCIGDQV